MPVTVVFFEDEDSTLETPTGLPLCSPKAQNLKVVLFPYSCWAIHLVSAPSMDLIKLILFLAVSFIMYFFALEKCFWTLLLSL